MSEAEETKAVERDHAGTRAQEDKLRDGEGKEHTARAPLPGLIPKRSEDEPYTRQEIEVLLDRFRKMASLLTGDDEPKAECTYCHQPVPLGEALLTVHLAGVLAHLTCPPEFLQLIVEANRPAEGFDYGSFSEAVDRRVAEPKADSCSGIIEIIVKES